MYSDELYKVLKILNSERAYDPKNIYLCRNCLDTAENALSKMKSNNGNQSKPPSLFVENVASSSSDSSIDKYVPQRGIKAGPTMKPCPKRFKKPVAAAQLERIQNTSNIVEMASINRAIAAKSP